MIAVLSFSSSSLLALLLLLLENIDILRVSVYFKFLTFFTVYYIDKVSTL